MSQLLPIAECARQLDVSAWQVRALVRAHKLTAIRVGAAYKFRQSDIDAYVESQATGPKSKVQRRGSNPVPVKDRIFS